MQIIDFIRKGNMVRFLLGDASSDYWGDDWNDAPYDCNAGEVYDRYVKGHRDMIFPFDDLVLEPCDGEYGDTWVTKEDMKNRRVPCIIVVPKALYEDTYKDAFHDWVGADGVQKFFFGDEMESEKEDDREQKPETRISLSELARMTMGKAEAKDAEALFQFLLRGDKDAVQENAITLHGLFILVERHAVSPKDAEKVIKKMQQVP